MPFDIDPLAAMPDDGSQRPDNALFKRGRTAMVSTSLGKSMTKNLSLSDKNDGEKLTKVDILFCCILRNPAYQGAMTAIIVFHLAMTWYETDQRAAQEPRAEWQVIAENMLLAAYVTDIVMRIQTQKRAFFKQVADVFDLVIVVVDFLGTIIEILLSGSTIGPVSLLRGLRALRIIRVVRKFSLFRDLYFMMKGMFGALRALVFAVVLLFSVLSLFSMLAVDLIYPVTKKLAEEGHYDGCERCERAFSSIMSSNLTFLSTIIAGDGWGWLSIPIMEEDSSTIPILLGVFLTVELALMNVITAVVVDRQAQAREDDKGLQHLLKHEREQASFKELEALFQEMDVDGGGGLCLEEMIEAYDHSIDFQKMLQWQDITRNDLPLLFEVMDSNGNGEIDYHEFVHELHRLRNVDMRTTAVMARQEAHSAHEATLQLKKMIEEIHERLDCGSSIRCKPRDSAAVEFNLKDSRASRVACMARTTSTIVDDGSECLTTPPAGMSPQSAVRPFGSPANLAAMMSDMPPLPPTAEPPNIGVTVTRQVKQDLMAAEQISLEGAFRAHLQSLRAQCDEVERQLEGHFAAMRIDTVDPSVEVMPSYEMMDSPHLGLPGTLDVGPLDVAPRIPSYRITPQGTGASLNGKTSTPTANGRKGSFSFSRQDSESRPAADALEWSLRKDPL